MAQKLFIESNGGCKYHSLTKSEREVFKKFCNNEYFNALNFLSAVEIWRPRFQDERKYKNFLTDRCCNLVSSNKLRTINHQLGYRSHDAERAHYDYDYRCFYVDFDEKLSRYATPEEQLLMYEDITEIAIQYRNSTKLQKSFLKRMTSKHYHGRQISEDDLKILSRYWNNKVINNWLSI